MRNVNDEFNRIFEEVVACDGVCPKCGAFRLRKRTPAGGTSSVWKCLAAGCDYVSLLTPGVRY